MSMIKGYVGSYTADENSGIYEFHFDTLREVFVYRNLKIPVKNAKYMSCANHTLAFPCRKEEPGVMLVNDKTSSFITHGAHVACYITQDDPFIYTVNYHDGALTRFRIEHDELQLCDEVIIEKGAGAHQVILCKDLILVPCRLLDKIYIFNRSDLSLHHILAFSKGSGPRHGVLNDLQDTLYLVSEDGCEVYDIDMKEFQIKRTLALLPNYEKGGAAAIRLSEDQRFLYISIREVNIVCVVDIAKWARIQRLDCGGNHPRDMHIDPSQSFVFVANRLSDNVCAFQRNQESGQLTLCDILEHVKEGVTIAFETE